MIQLVDLLCILSLISQSSYVQSTRLVHILHVFYLYWTCMIIPSALDPSSSTSIEEIPFFFNTFRINRRHLIRSLQAAVRHSIQLYANMYDIIIYIYLLLVQNLTCLVTEWEFLCNKMYNNTMPCTEHDLGYFRAYNMNTYKQWNLSNERRHTCMYAYLLVMDTYIDCTYACNVNCIKKCIRT